MFDDNFESTGANLIVAALATAGTVATAMLTYYVCCRKNGSTPEERARKMAAANHKSFTGHHPEADPRLIKRFDR